MRLLFVSPRFLFPTDEGGKIRTAQILRGMKGGTFRITLASPGPPSAGAHGGEIARVCDEFVPWPPRRRGPWHALARIRYLASPLPVSVASDRDASARRVVARELERGHDVVVFDFVHTAVLAPELLAMPSVLFTHNVESEIFRREAELAPAWQRPIWRGQWRKMQAFERRALQRFDEVVAVSRNDAQVFASAFGVERVTAISTGVDLDDFPYAGPPAGDTVVFTGALDWHANRDGIRFLLEEIWPQVLARRPGARLVVVGRNPPASLEQLGADRRCTFTGFVDDVRPYIREASAYAIPLRVGGGTRIKVYEAMATGCPVVSTSVGVEGLPVRADEHLLLADDRGAFARALCVLLEDGPRRAELSRRARAHVEAHASHLQSAREFEAVCRRAAGGQRSSVPDG